MDRKQQKVMGTVNILDVDKYAWVGKEGKLNGFHVVWSCKQEHAH